MLVATIFKKEVYPVDKGSKGSVELDDPEYDAYVFFTWQTVVSAVKSAKIFDSPCKPTDRQLRKWKKEVCHESGRIQKPL